MMLSHSILKIFSLYRGLPRSVYTLFIATIVNGAGIFVFPFLTLFLTQKLGMDARQAGNYMFFTSLAYLPGSLLGGKLADRYGRKVLAIVAQLLAAAFYIPCGFLVLRGLTPVSGGELSSLFTFLSAGSFIPLLILANIIFDGFADPARGAMHTDLTTPENRQAAFSLNYLGHNLGFALGPLIAGFLFNVAPQWLFWGNALAVLVATSLVALFVPETKPTDAAITASLATNSTEKAHVGSFLSAIRSRPYLISFVILTSGFGLVYGQHRFTIPLQTEKLFGSSGAALYGLMMTMNAVFVVIFTAPLIALLKHIRPILNVALAGLLYAIGFGMLAFVQLPLFFFASVFIWTMGEIINATNADVYIANHTPMSHRGRFGSILPFLGGFGWALATPVGGNIIHVAGISAVWIVMFVVAALVSLALLLLDYLERRPKGKRI